MPPFPNVEWNQTRTPSNLQNWYGDEEFRGCLLRWERPDEAVVGYIFLRSSKPLPPDCMERMGRGEFKGFAEQILVKRPIDAMVDDQVHDRNRYALIARTKTGKFIPIRGLQTSKFSDAIDRKSLGQVAFWSNPHGRPKPQEPYRLDYLAVKPSEVFSGFSWSYPDDIIDVVSYHLLVSPQPISAHNATRQEIAEFRALVIGKTARLLQIEPFVTHLQDNLTEPGTYIYFALLAVDSNKGRTQIPLMHHRDPFPSELPCRYLKKIDGQLVRGLPAMQGAFVAWKKKRIDEKKAAVGKASPSPSETSSPQTSAPHAKPRGPAFAMLHLANPPSPSRYQENLRFLGVQISWPKPPPGSTIIALRSRQELPVKPLPVWLSGRALLPPGCERLEFKDAETLIDVECHDREWYYIAIVDGDDLRTPGELNERSLQHLPRQDDPSIIWHCPGEPLRDRMSPVLDLEHIRRMNDTPIGVEFGAHDLLEEPSYIELYHFHDHLDVTAMDEERRTALQKFIREGVGDFGTRFVLEGEIFGVQDDLLPIQTSCHLAALILDEHNNRFSVPVYTVDPEESEDWPLLSSLLKPEETSKLQIPLQAQIPAEGYLLKGREGQDDIGLSTLDELRELGAEGDPQSKDGNSAPLPRFEYVGTSQGPTSSDSSAQILDPSPSEPISVISDLTMVDPSDITASFSSREELLALDLLVRSEVRAARSFLRTGDLGEANESLSRARKLAPESVRLLAFEVAHSEELKRA